MKNKIGVAIVVVLLVLCGTVSVLFSFNQKSEKKETAIVAMTPDPKVIFKDKNLPCEYQQEGNTYYAIRIPDMTSDQFETYISFCPNSFPEENYRDESAYRAFTTDEKYQLEVMLDSDAMYIFVKGVSDYE